jgi:CHAT domain-containing protein
MEEAKRRLEALLAKHPGDPRFLLTLAYVEDALGLEGTESLYREVLERCRASGDLEGTVRASESLWWIFNREGRLEEAGEIVQEAKTAAAGTSDPLLQARATILEARHLLNTDTDLTHAYELLQGCRGTLFPGAPFGLRNRWLDVTAKVAYYLEFLDQAARCYEQKAELNASQGDRVSAAKARANQLIMLREKLEDSTDSHDLEHLIDLARATLGEAVAADDAKSQIHAATLLSDALEIAGDPEGAKDAAHRCLEAARKAGSDDDLRDCTLLLALRTAHDDPAAARELLDEALAMETPGGDAATQRVYDALQEMRIAWSAGWHEEAYRLSLEALDAIEDLRDGQSDASGRARVFAGWARMYPWIVGRLLEAHTHGGSRRDLERALEITERMRSRVLLDILDSAQVTADESEELRAKRDQKARLLAEIARIQRRLRRRGLPAAEQRRLSDALETLEAEESRAQREIERLNPRFAGLERPTFATLEQVQAALAPKEAMMSFLLAPWQSVTERFAGGSWLIVLTREQARVYRLDRLPVGDHLEDSISLFAGFFESRGDAPDAAAVRLYRDLLEQAVEELPPAVDSLILIPDGPLHQLPFAVLKPSPEAPPLAARYELTRVPSATLWLEWRGQTPGSTELPALVLADPDLGARTDEPAAPRATLRGWDPVRGADLSPLPFARREGWSVRRHLGRNTELLTGGEASEVAVKTADLSRFGLLHFAAHATPDSQSPERSTVHLAPGAPDEDGWLQFREIAELRFAGRPVVLSTCHSAAGRVLRGEGVLDLARAFFQGGSNAVVASLWRIEDRATAAFFDTFYRRIAQGGSLSEAHQRAQRELLEAGAPASAWAGIVVLGDGEIVPVPRPRRRTPAGVLVWTALTLLAAAVALAARRRAAVP